MNLSLRRLMLEVIVEAAFGKKFKLKMEKDGKESTWLGMATANAKPGELPYRITWFSIGQYLIQGDIPDNRHVDLSFEEMQSILHLHQFPPEIVQRISKRYPNDQSPLIGDKYWIAF
jgi:hypothetical protein